MNSRPYVLAAAIALAAAVVLGALGAHAAKGWLTAAPLAIYQTAVQYHFWHALGLLGVSLLMEQWPAARALVWAGWLLIGGMIFFCGSLYVLAVTGATWISVLTPIGGSAFIAGWLAVAWAALRRR